MKQILIPLVAAVVGGGSVALLTQPISGADTTNQVSLSEVQELRDQVASLGMENRVLTSRVDSLERRPTLSSEPVEIVREDAEGNPLEAEVAELRDLVQGLAPRNEPVLREQVGDVLRELREQEDKEREETRAKQRDEAMEQRLAEIAKELNLSQYQSDVLRQTWDDSRKKMDELRASGNFGDFRETMDGLREESLKKLGAAFTTDQLNQYTEKYGSGRNMFGGGGGRGGGGFGRGGRGG